MLSVTATDLLARSLTDLEVVVADRLDRRQGVSDGTGPPTIPARDRYRGDGPLGDLVDRAELDAVDALIVVAALAPQVDARWIGWYRELDRASGDHGLSVEVARQLACASFGARINLTERMRADSALVKMGIVEVSSVGLHTRIDLTPGIADFLLGFPPMSPHLDTGFPAVPLTTVHDRSSLILRDDVADLLDRLIDRIANETRVLDDWGLADKLDHARGVVALFHGPPGTGKSLAAAVTAKAAGLAAYRVDMQACVSKYIGETEKNLDRVFARAEADGSMLFFDEADSCFGKRTEVHDARDRYANNDISYLLQRIEQHSGVVVLATNLPGALDEAFERRIDIEIEFVRPGRHERLQLWKSLLPDALPLGTSVDVAHCADQFDLSGGEIRNAVLDAAHRAARQDAAVTAADLRAAIGAQFAKSGRMMPSGV